MDLILNGEPCAIDTSDCLNLAELLARAERQGGGAEASVVVSVEVDGEPVPADLLGAPETVLLGESQCVRLVRRPTRDVALGVLEQGADYCIRIVAAIGEAIEHQRSGRDEAGNRLLADILDSLSILTGVTYSIASALPDEARALAELQGEIQPWLEEMLEAQSAVDPIRIADLLEYEIAPRIGSWGKRMREFVDAKARASACR